MVIEKRTCDEEYNKDPRLNKDDIRQLQQWVQKQPHLPKITELMLIQLYDSSLFSVQRTKELIETHYRFRTDAPEIFSGKDYEPPRYTLSYWDTVYFLYLPNLTPEGYRIIYCGFKNLDPSTFHLEVAIAMFTKAMVAITVAHGTCNGYAFVFDIHGIVLSHLATVTISLVRKYLYFVQEAAPLKVKAVHVIHVHSLIDKIMLLVKPFLNKELYDMIYIQSDMNEFYKTVGKENIPIDLGGTLSLTRDELLKTTRETVEALDDVVDKELHLRIDESKRIGGKRDESALMAGSFKKLAID